MVEMDTEDSLTKLNTQLNRSMVLMDRTQSDDVPLQRSVKTIKINTKAQPASPSNTQRNMPRKSILKKTPLEKNVNSNTSNNESTIESELERLNNETQQRLSMGETITPRPQNIQDLLEKEGLVVDNTECTLNIDDLSDSEEIWIMEIPKTINPSDLKGQTLTLGEKSKFKINEERYCAVKHNTKSDFTCVFNVGKAKQKTVKIKPIGGIAIRRKLSSHQKIKPVVAENESVPFPKNLKTRHPLFGVQHTGKVRKSKTRISEQ